MTEIEIKVQVEQSAALVAFLKDNAKSVKQEHQVDEYFDSSRESFLAATPVVEWLRLRTEDSKFEINYKKWHVETNGTSNYADEYETEVADPAAARAIFAALQYVPLVTVDKLRTSYFYQDYEVSIDEVKDLGTFIEIEYKGQTKRDPAEVAEEMLAFLKEHNVGAMERGFKGYPKLLLEQKAAEVSHG